MQAAWYEAQGAARAVLVVGSMPDPHPGPGEVRIRVAASGINPGDLKKREDSFGLGMAYPRVIPHSDGAGVIDAVGAGVSATRIGERVWCFGAQSYRAFGTAAQYTVVPEQQAVSLPKIVAFETGACLGIPALTAHRAVHAGGPVAGRDVLVQGGAGGVGSFVCGFARRAGARVIATVRSDADEHAARNAGLRVCGTRLERVGERDALMLDRFDREWNPDANAYSRYGLVSGLTVIDAEDGHLGRERWSYPLLADELRRWSVKSNDDRRELFLRMVFNAMVTNNDDHPRNHALLQTRGGWRLSPAYDILPVPMVSVERRDLALELGRFGRAASLYNILSHCDAFGLSKEEAQALNDRMLNVVRGWREFFVQRGVEQRSVEMLEQAMLPPSFFRDTPPDAV